jgi:hypothetical protein
MRFRKLRITWSVAWGLAAVLLIALWTHTLHYQVRVEGWVSKSHFIQFVMFKHWMGCTATSYQIAAGNWYPRATFQDNPVAPSQEKGASPSRGWRSKLSSGPGQSSFTVTAPFWFPMLLTTLLVVAPWLQSLSWRFSLRTLLIATTLVAVVLGLVVWLR